MKTIINMLWIAIAAITSTLLTSCDDDDPVIPNEEELITTVNFVLSPTNGGSDVTLSWKDLDGDGNGDITGGTLAANSTYDGTITLLNESESPIENITLEVQAESEDHQFFYEVENTLKLEVDYSDQDANSHPIGLITSVVSGDASSGSLTIILRHEPDKSAANVANGDKTNAGGATDIEVSFPITIQ